MSRLNVLQLTGSPKDSFHEQLSLTYARDCADALSEVADFLYLHTAPGGKHFILSSIDKAAIANAKPITLGQAIDAISLTQLDLALPQMFCQAGMTDYRAMLDLIGVSYLGNTPHAMALTFDKARTRSIVSAAGVRVPAGLVLDMGSRSWQSAASRNEAFSRFEFPIIVKPNRCDNSVGVVLAGDAESLGEAFAVAAQHSDDVLVEQFIAPGREVRCGVVELDGELKCLPLQEYDVNSQKPIRLPEDKVTTDDGGALQLTSRLRKTSRPVSLDDPITESVHDLAKKAHVALGCRDYSLFDFRIDPEGVAWFLEAGLYCSFAHSSVIATMAGYAEIDVCDLLLDLARQTNNKPLQAC